MTTLWRSPNVVGRVGWAADFGKGLAAVVVGGAAVGGTTRVPPMQEAAAVAVPAAYRGQTLQERLLGRGATLATVPRAADERSE